MIFNGEIEVEAPREAVFRALADAEFFASCVEGVQDLTRVDDTHYTARLDTKVAYLRFRFDVDVRLTRVEPVEVIEAKVEGVPLGVVGRLTGTSTAHLEECDGGTSIRYAMEVALAGKLGSLGQPVLRAKAREMERKFAARLRSAFEELGEAPS
jgi:uncharacterized protein